MTKVGTAGGPPLKTGKPKGMGAFSIIWVGQIISFFGSSMTGFALTFWVWMVTHQATAMALMGLFRFIPQIIMTPVAGALVDRWNRKKTMIISDLAGGIGTGTILLLYMSENLEIWHLYAIGMFLGAFSAFQWPAYSAAISTMVHKRHYARTSAMMGMTEGISMIFGPPIAAILLVTIYMPGIMTFDIISFTVAIITLLVVFIPEPTRTGNPAKGIKGLWKDTLYGFSYIYERKPLFGLTLTFFTFNLISSFGMIIVAPAILARTNSNATILGIAEAALGIGALVGGMILAIWGGPKRKIHGLLGGMAMTFVAGAAFAPNNPHIWYVGGFIFMVFMPITNGCSQAIWQSKVRPEYQGRVFGARALIAQISNTFGMILVGPLADRMFEPAMMPGGGLAPIFGWVVGTGPGAGMALMFVITCFLCSLVGIIAYGIPTVRNVEDLIPDHKEYAEEGEQAEGDGKKVRSQSIAERSRKPP